MTETAFHVETREDFNALLEQLLLFDYNYRFFSWQDIWDRYKSKTVVYAKVPSSSGLLFSDVQYYYDHSDAADYLIKFKSGMQLSLDNRGFHVSSVDTFPYAIKETPSSAESVSDSIQQLIAEHGVDSVAEGIELWITRNSFGTSVTEPVEPRYTVVLPNPNVSKGAQLIVLRKQGTQPDSKLQLSKIKQSTFDSGSEMNQLTEAEIKKDFDWAWQFAQEVK